MHQEKMRVVLHILLTGRVLLLPHLQSLLIRLPAMFPPYSPSSGISNTSPPPFPFPFLGEEVFGFDNASFSGTDNILGTMRRVSTLQASHWVLGSAVQGL
jgi:hypothetical protein